MKIAKPEDMKTYEVKLTGFGKLQLKHADYLKIKNIWGDDDISGNTPLKIGKKDFKKHQIAGIEEIDHAFEVKIKEERNKQVNDEVKADQEIYLRDVKLSPKDKSERFGAFKCIFQATTGVEPEQKYIDIAREIQLKFFTDNPKHTRCDWRLYKELCRQALRDMDINRPQTSLTSKGVIALIARVFDNDCMNIKKFS